MEEMMLTINTIVLALTLGAIVWYSWETNKVKKEMMRQNELNVCPYIAVSMMSNGVFIYKNIGKGPAINIQTENIDILDNRFDKITMTIKFPNISHIEVNGKGQITPNVYDFNGNSLPLGNALIFLDPSYAKDSTEIPIHYEDILKTPYETILGCGKDGIRVLRFGKRKGKHG